MKYLKSYEEHNEGIKSGLTKLGIVGSLLLNSPDSKGQYTNPYDYSNPSNVTNILSPMSPLNPNGYFQKSMSDINDHDISNYKAVPNEEYNDPGRADKYKKMDSTQLQKELDAWVRKMKFQAEIAEEYSKSMKKSDDTLSKILSNIDSVAKSGGDSIRFNELFGNLTSHMKEKYGYEIPNQNIEKLNDETILDLSNGLSKKDLFALMGWLGSILLASCGIPQAWSSYKDKHSHGMSWAFLLLWAFGELFAMIYVYDKLDLPMMMNYGTNILILAIMIYYKIRPGSNGNSE